MDLIENIYLHVEKLVELWHAQHAGSGGIGKKKTLSKFMPFAAEG